MTEEAPARERYQGVVESDGSIAIPPQLLRDYGWVPGDDLAVDVINGAIVIRRAESS